MSELFPAGGFPATHAEFPDSLYVPPPPAPAEMPVRVLAAAGGLIALLIGTILSLGMSLGALLGIGIAALVRRRELTRLTSWAGAVLMVMLLLAGLTAFALEQTPGGLSGFRREMQRDMDEADRQPPPPEVRKLQKIFPQMDPRAQREQQRAFRSGPAMWWMIGFTFAGFIFFLGALIGSGAWGCFMLIGFGIRGRWPLPPKPRAPKPRAPIPLIVE